MQKSDYSREKVKRRLRKQAAEIWGFQDAEMEGFDPVVDLLLGACSVEFEKIANEVFSSETRVLERLAHLLIPEVLTVARPAHAVLHACPVEAIYHVKTSDQFVFNKEVIDRYDAAKLVIKPIYFSPSAAITLFDASIAFQATANRVMQLTTPILKDEFIKSTDQKFLEPSTLWLGLDIHQSITSLKGMSFFFDWKNDPDKPGYFQLLSLARWFIHEQEIATRSGLGQSIEDEYVRQGEAVDKAYENTRKIEQHSQHVYKSCFITLEEKEVNLQKEKYPAAFEEVFTEKDLQKLKKDLLWIKIQLPQGLPPHAVAEMSCVLNCFPVINRKLTSSNRPFALEKSFNILPLHTGEDDFLSVRRVYASNSKEYQEIPFQRITQQEPETFTVRRGGVGRFDRRNAAEMVRYLMDMMRDESVAFGALGGPALSKEIKQLEQNLTRLEQNSLRNDPGQETAPYILIKPNQPEEIWVEYWTTSGPFANHIPAGSKLKAVTSLDFKKEDIYLLSSSFGGRSALDDVEKLYAYKSALLSRGRIVTVQDIKAACFAELGKKITHVEVKKGVAVDPRPHKGLVRTLDIHLSPSKKFKASPQEWEALCRDLQVFLKQNATAMATPLRVMVANQGLE